MRPPESDGGIPDGRCAALHLRLVGRLVYGERERRPKPEHAPKQPESPYGVSRCPASSTCSTPTRCTVSIRPLRYSKVFGPRQGPHGEGVVRHPRIPTAEGWAAHDLSATVARRATMCISATPWRQYAPQRGHGCRRRATSTTAASMSAQASRPA